MAFAEQYRRQVALLVRIMPFIAEEACFALKGGTAINLFVRDMPRLSVDIDLTYLPVKGRAESLAEISEALKHIASQIRGAIKEARVTETGDDGAVRKLVIRTQTAQVQIEVTPVLRGCVFEPQMLTVRPSVEETFGFAEARVVSFADLYGGKLIAALDRQHPRDLFDVRDLLANEGIDDALRIAFLVYLISHDRPMAEVLTCVRKDITDSYKRNFAGMTDREIPLDELLTARETMVARIVGEMPAAHKEFLISFETGDPQWDLIGVPGAADLPAVRWRQINLNKLTKERRDELVAQLTKVLGVSEE